MGIKFFRKNIFDLSNGQASVTVTDAVATSDGVGSLPFMRNRENRTAWMTTESTDAANTTIEIDFTDERTFNYILLLNHNLKSYTIQYWNGSSYVNFSTAINETTNTLSSTSHSFNTIQSSKIKLIITGAQIANADKYISQFIVTELLGELVIEPKITPEFNKDKKITKYISGKSFIAKSVGAFNAKLTHESVSLEADLDLIETVFNQFEGVLFWPSGGTTNQYETLRLGWTVQDIFYVAASNDYQPEWVDGRYRNGMPLNMNLLEIN